MRLSLAGLAVCAVIAGFPGSALADCWGTVRYVAKGPDGSIGFGIVPLDGKSCDCQSAAGGAIGTGSIQYTVPASAGNVREAYATLLLATTMKTALYVFETPGSCVATSIMAYTQ